MSYYPKRVKGSELQLGDVVRLGPIGNYGPNKFSDAVVIQITDKEIHLFRPYAITADFQYTGGVIPYIGIEQFHAYDKKNDYLVIERRTEPLR